MFLNEKKYLSAGLAALLLLCCICSFAQPSSDYKKKRFTFHIEKPDTSISFEVCAVNPKVIARENSSYSWYLDNKIIETKGGFSGRLLHGRYESYYGNKSLRERGTYIKGRKEGKWIKWHSNGKINEISYWRMGVKQGKYVLFNDMGQKMLFAHFKKDKLNGTLTSYEKDKILSKRKYRNGNEVPVKIPKDKSRSASTDKKEKPSFLKSIFKKKEKKDKPVKDSKKKTASMSSTQQ
jgi:hypothetical protein